ncbi:MAG: hypothetical protein QW724_01360 [Nitrososphaerota archaeon]
MKYYNKFFSALIVLILGVLVLENAIAAFPTPSQSDISSLTEGWVKVVSGGFNDTNNVGITNFVDFKGYRYIGVINSEKGGEIWRTQDGDNWEKIGPDGLGNPNNHEITLFVFRDKLYAGTNNNEDGAEIWFSHDGINFKKLVSGGLGDKDNVGVGLPIIFNDKLLVPVQNGNLRSLRDGAEIWASEDGEHFQRNVKDGLGDRSNFLIYFFPQVFKDHKFIGFEATTFNEHVFLGTYNPNGAEIWRSKDGVNWERIIDNGFNDTGNIAIANMRIFRDQLYVVTFNLKGLNVFRTYDGKNWEKVVENGFRAGEYKNMFGVLTEINGALYLSTFSTPTVGAFQIWRSNDGKNWTQLGLTGFGNKNNHGAGISLLSDGCLYVSTTNTVDGLEVWKSRDSLNWEIIFKEEITSKTHIGGGIVEFNNHLYMYIYDSENGIEIWKYTSPLRPITVIQTSTQTSIYTIPTTKTTTSKLPTTQITTAEKLTAAESTSVISTQTVTISETGWGAQEYAIIGIIAVVAIVAVFFILKITIWSRPLPPPPPP